MSKRTKSVMILTIITALCRGELRLKPLENGTKTLIFGSGGINLDKDDGLISRIAKTGAFPLENMLNMTSAQSLLAFIRIEAEKREGG